MRETKTVERRTVLIRTIEATAKLMDGTELNIATNDEGRKLAAMQRPGKSGSAPETVLYVHPDDHDSWLGEPGDIGRLQPDPGWLKDRAYMLTRALAHLVSEVPPGNPDDLRPRDADMKATREPGTARIRIPATMKATRVEGIAFGRSLVCTLLSESEGAAQTTFAVLAGTQAATKPDICEIDD